MNAKIKVLIFCALLGDGISRFLNYLRITYVMIALAGTLIAAYSGQRAGWFGHAAAGIILAHRLLGWLRIERGAGK